VKTRSGFSVRYVIRLTLRSLTRPAPGRWWLAFPAILLAQKRYRWRYQRALRLVGA